MGLFRSLGRKAEEIKREFADDTAYGCVSCETALDENYDACPHCGSENVVAVET